ncbi:CRISPR-associated protein [Pseudoalteromonas luteoviolacea CPMOR-1]|uniref:CRISPR-associated protein n=1 Tax=Pseudoalteromonas luteoviolacea CPMOR-1 TaxID=1365248 RepID=A0A167IB63_9GAMM|nr:type I-F CRISPR-associated protein Csy2 [Pseudoalteromonas luteoviolacea]KZN59138.1 CRISPR-associated protein [Pseudoalteromonas luteoviolacea CPMOR-1]
MKVIVLPHIKVHNANALSSPFTIGFPAMTAWLGFTHALERKLIQQGYTELMLQSVAVISHDCNVQTHKCEGDFVHSIIGTGNPLEKDGKRSAFIEEARCHLDVSLVIEYSGDEEKIAQTNFTEQLQDFIASMKVAGGDILTIQKPKLESVIEELDSKRLVRQLMPGYALIERRDLMIEAMQQGDDALDALLSYLTINHSCEKKDDDSVVWQTSRKEDGWLVPIATGFQGISPLGEAKNQRDPTTPHRFAESVVTLGEFVMAHKVKNLDDILWEYNPELENDLYLCQQVNATNE